MAINTGHMAERGRTIELSGIDPFQFLTMMEGALRNGWPPVDGARMISEIKKGLVQAGHLPDTALEKINAFGKDVSEIRDTMAGKLVHGIHDVIGHPSMPAHTVEAAVEIPKGPTRTS